jgi:hypothetical protein
MELFLETPLYITKTYGLNMMISTFFPLEYGEFGGFFSKTIHYKEFAKDFANQ